MKTAIKTLCILILSLTILSIIPPQPATANTGTYINVTFILSCREIVLPVPFSSIVADPNYLMTVRDQLDAQICSDDDGNGDLNTEVDETNDDVTLPANP